MCSGIFFDADGNDETMEVLTQAIEEEDAQVCLNAQPVLLAEITDAISHPERAVPRHSQNENPLDKGAVLLYLNKEILAMDTMIKAVTPGTDMHTYYMGISCALKSTRRLVSDGTFDLTGTKA